MCAENCAQKKLRRENCARAPAELVGQLPQPKIGDHLHHPVRHVEADEADAVLPRVREDLGVLVDVVPPRLPPLHPLLELGEGAAAVGAAAEDERVERRLVLAVAHLEADRERLAVEVVHAAHQLVLHQVVQRVRVRLAREDDARVAVAVQRRLDVPRRRRRQVGADARIEEHGARAVVLLELLRVDLPARRVE